MIQLDIGDKVRLKRTTFTTVYDVIGRIINVKYINSERTYQMEVVSYKTTDDRINLTDTVEFLICDVDFIYNEITCAWRYFREQKKETNKRSIS